uniref:Uncharacterized protein n=1 Tax=Romanomermis culicivorax TaxID=13658 RepID=A0A915IBG5_ROMCU
MVHLVLLFDLAPINIKAELPQKSRAYVKYHAQRFLTYGSHARSAVPELWSKTTQLSTVASS